MSTKPDLSAFEDEEGFDKSAAPRAAANTNINTGVHTPVCREIISSLTEKQAAAAQSPAKTILLIAPAGTGKTRAIQGRVASLMLGGANPNRLLVSTFTNAAAEELKDRLKSTIYTPVDDLWVGTLHSIGMRILREHADRLGLAPKDSVLDTDDQLQILRWAMAEAKHSMSETDERVALKRIPEFIETCKGMMIDPKKALAQHTDRQLKWAHGINEEDIRVYEAYERYKQMYGLIDYADMLFLPTQLLETDEKVRELWRGKFDHILVDEYQDLAKAQIRFLTNLRGPDSTFFAAADDDQCIYGWRGSELQITTKFQDYWPEAEILDLDINWRTPRNIFTHAKSLIINNIERHPKQVKTAEKKGSNIRLIECADEIQEQDLIAENLKVENIDRGIAWEDMAILCRSNRTCKSLASALAADGIPVNLHESLPTGTEPVKTLLAYVQAALGGDNTIIFERLARYPMRLLSESKLSEVTGRIHVRNSREKANKQPITGPIAYLRERREAGAVPEGSGTWILLKNIEDVEKLIKDNPGTPFAAAGAHLGIADKAQQSDKPEDHLYGRFVYLADGMLARLPLEKVLGAIHTLDINSGRTGVNITTMHGAKGLEFKVVVAPGWEEGEFPSRASSDDQERLAEERRLAYVTVTRAMDRVYITTCSHRRGRSNPSRFIKELDLISAEQQGFATGTDG